MNSSKITKIGYWVSTAIMCGIFAFSASMYFTKTEMVRGFFDQLGYPSYIVIPLAIAKVLGIIAILSNVSKLLAEWAYAGFLIDAILALVAHYMVQGGGYEMSGLAIFAILVSRYFYGKLNRRSHATH